MLLLDSANCGKTQNLFKFALKNRGYQKQVITNPHSLSHQMLVFCKNFGMEGLNGAIEKNMFILPCGVVF